MRVRVGHVRNRKFLTQTGGCLCIIKQQNTVYYVDFSPTHPNHIISVSDGEVWQWDINGHQIPPIYNGFYIAFSQDHTQFALCNKEVITVQNSDSRAIVAAFCLANSETRYCCFSPDGRLVAAAAGNTAYIWNITGPGSHCQEFRLFKPFRLSFSRTQDSFPTNTHSRHDITQISRTTERIVLCNA